MLDNCDIDFFLTFAMAKSEHFQILNQSDWDQNFAVNFWNHWKQKQKVNEILCCKVIWSVSLWALLIIIKRWAGKGHGGLIVFFCLWFRLEKQGACWYIEGIKSVSVVPLLSILWLTPWRHCTATIGTVKWQTPHTMIDRSCLMYPSS